jgi:hypothetical protein
VLTMMKTWNFYKPPPSCAVKKTFEPITKNARRK